MKTVDNFIAYFSELAPIERTTNLYQGDSKLTTIRRHNLKRYLELMQDKKPTILLIGEAPGYNGCRLTGISFTSEYILSQSSKYGLGDSSFYLFSDKIKRQKEISATIVWEQLSKHQSFLPLIWNIFPLHPYNSNSEKSNRTPTKDELKIGLDILIQLLSLFPTITTVRAIGKKSYNILNSSNYKFEKYDIEYIRHPANRGKNKFIDGITRLFVR